ncbi:XRE family transcriptional regulator [Paenibacillus anaericanus]|uniref:XRE family transcriptional regulator n=1 Tax=Paenibacillus anaericanus TaxID=170367 RepID=A0A433YBZ6_9BACL|nr:helix-turn-helix transcriptional regulator [Paenibacillus anaericanus]RUT47375.1 XRE family transcriptional regulator [Paenibacillus anaericanus]
MSEYILRMIGLRVRDLRKKKGLSQEELGERAGVHFSYIGGVERAEKNISLLSLQKIASALEADIVELFQYEKLIGQGLMEKDKNLNDLVEYLVTLDGNDIKKLHILALQLFEDK